MRRLGKLVVVCLLCSFAFPVFAEKSESPRILKDRPRVFLGPYNDLAIDHYYYGLGYSRYGYASYRPLLFHGYVAPGRSSVSFAVGSDGYMGTSFSTSNFIQGTPLIYSLSSSWERGETWWTGQDYDLNTISAALMWANETTSITLGVDVSELRIDEQSSRRAEQPRVDGGLTMDDLPFRREYNSDIDYQSVNFGVSHRIGDHAHLFFSVGEDVFDRDRVSIGLNHRLWDRVLR